MRRVEVLTCEENVWEETLEDDTSVPMVFDSILAALTELDEFIEDMNDNEMEFDEDDYTISIREEDGSVTILSIEEARELTAGEKQAVECSHELEQEIPSSSNPAPARRI